MSQHDMDVANGPGLAVRTDINNALQALASQSSGASAPSLTFPCQLWADTGTGRLKRRDSANTLWLDIGILDALGEIQTVASATLTDIGAATSKVVAVTGTTAITGLGSTVAGVMRTVRFSGVLVLTHNATSLILPGAANITTAVNDTFEFLSLGGGNWQCTQYTPANGAYGRSNILGTVSQTGGVPTGAIIESGSNANGTFVKYADGTMICSRQTTVAGVGMTNAVGSLFYYAWGAQTFASPFIAAPVVSNSAYAPGAAIWATTGLVTTTSTGAFLVMSPTSQVATVTVHTTAIGRWF